MTRFTGSNPERQSVGHPGHCDACAERGHAAAHPDLGCADVGCYAAHDEPDEPALAAAIPVAVLLWDASDPVLPPTTFHAGSTHSDLSRVPVHLFHAFREERMDRAPVGCLYTGTGGHRLDDLFATMWTCDEAVALRTLKHEDRWSVSNLAACEQANDALARLWIAFLDGVNR